MIIFWGTRVVQRYIPFPHGIKVVVNKSSKYTEIFNYSNDTYMSILVHHIHIISYLGIV